MMRRVIILLVAIIVSIGVYGASKTASKIPSDERDIGSIQMLQNRTIDQLDNICDDLDSLFTQTVGVHADSAAKTAIDVQRLWVDSTWVTSLRDDNSNRFLGVTKKYSITACGDFDTSADNTTEQGYCFDSLPAYARLMDVWVICTEQVLDTGDAAAIMALEIGITDGGAEAMATGDIDSTDEIGAMSVSEAYDVLPVVTTQPLFLNATPDTVWLNILQGEWDVYIQYNDNASY